MAWMSDEAFDLKQENREKKVTAQSARNRRGHTGKGGAVRMPSDNLTKKQREALNGECKTYRMGAPMKWGEFVGMPEDLQVMYIKGLRKTYNVPNKVLAEMLGISVSLISRYFKSIGLTKLKGAKNNWNAEEKAAFYAWIEKRGKKDISTEETVDSTDNDVELQKYIENDIATANTATKYDYTPCEEQPVNVKEGQITLEGSVDDILCTLRRIIGNTNVRLYADWSVVELPTTNTTIDIQKWRNCIQVAKNALLNAERREATGSKG